MLASSFALGLALLAPSIYAQNCPSGPTGQSYFSPVLLNDQVYIVGGSLVFFTKKMDRQIQS